MAIWRVVIPDEIDGRVKNKFCKATNYPEMVPDAEGNMIPNPMEKKAWCELMLVNYVKQNVKMWEEYEEKAASTAGSGLDGIGS